MAITVYKHGAQIIRKYDDVFTDFPLNGVGISDTLTLGVVNNSTNSVTVQYTMDNQESIDDGTAIWFNDSVVAAGSDLYLVLEYACTGIKLIASSNGATAWFKT